ncbi:dehydrogenase/reductase SDR family member 11-like [Antedon mediterranea]|uniref:dehydrogenase/reductase SDR family member 11-like n=1 Tax=Antedon mediterranea TaxID=105859 RepID=UPI003AF66BE4
MVLIKSRPTLILKAIADELKPHASGVLHPIQCDVSKEDDIKAMFSEIKERFGGVDVCVNNAHVLPFDSPVMSGNIENWRYILDAINVMALAICTRESIYQMTERGIDDGHIFHINSLSGHRVNGSGLYAGTKHLVTAMTEELRQELREKKSRITVTNLEDDNIANTLVHALHAPYCQNLETDDIANYLVRTLPAPSYCQIHDILTRPRE